MLYLKAKQTSVSHVGILPKPPQLYPSNSPRPDNAALESHCRLLVSARGLRSCTKARKYSRRSARRPEARSQPCIGLRHPSSSRSGIRARESRGAHRHRTSQIDKNRGIAYRLRPLPRRSHEIPIMTMHHHGREIRQPFKPLVPRIKRLG